VSCPIKHRVLVVDDERSIRDVIYVALTRAGFDVRAAADGADGLSAVREWSPECILLDVTVLAAIFMSLSVPAATVASKTEPHSFAIRSVVENATGTLVDDDILIFAEIDGRAFL
jgi:ActR/RegA family two-component response regulator